MSSQETKIIGQLYALHQIVAFLLARESIRENGNFTDIGNALSDDISVSISELSSSEEINKNYDTTVLVQSINDEIKSIFSLAEAFYKKMQDKC